MLSAELRKKLAVGSLQGRKIGVSCESGLLTADCQLPTENLLGCIDMMFFLLMMGEFFFFCHELFFF